MNDYINVIKKYAVFSGRSSRKEYWMFILCHLIIGSILNNIGRVTNNNLRPIFTIYCLALLLPGLAVSIRRLHDTSRSGWWSFVSAIPLVGWVILFVLMVQDSTPGANQYGPNPKEIKTT